MSGLLSNASRALLRPANPRDYTHTASRIICATLPVTIASTLARPAHGAFMGFTTCRMVSIPPPLNGKLPCFFKCPQGAKLPHGRIKLPAMAFGCTNCGVCEARPFICGFVGILPFGMNPIRKDAAFYSLQPRSIGVEYGHWCRMEGATFRP